MTLPIPPVAPLSSKSVAPTQTLDEIGVGLTPPVEPSSAGGGFAKAVSDALDSITGLEGQVDRASRMAATGDLSSVSDYMIATSEAQLATEITVAIRDRAIAAFNDIMRMQI